MTPTTACTRPHIHNETPQRGRPRGLLCKPGGFWGVMFISRQDTCRLARRPSQVQTPGYTKTTYISDYVKYASTCKCVCICLHQTWDPHCGFPFEAIPKRWPQQRHTQKVKYWRTHSCPAYERHPLPRPPIILRAEKEKPSQVSLALGRFTVVQRGVWQNISLPLRMKYGAHRMVLNKRIFISGVHQTGKTSCRSAKKRPSFWGSLLGSPSLHPSSSHPIPPLKP